MRPALIVLGASALALSSGAWAQHAGHGAQTDSPAVPASAEPTCMPEHAAMGHCTLPSVPVTDPHAGHEVPATGQPQPDPHAQHGVQAPLQTDPHAGHSVPAEPTADPHAGHNAPEQPKPDPHAGHSTPRAADAHAGHAMPGASGEASPPVAPPPAEAFQGPEHAGTTVWDRDLFLRKRDDALIEEHGGFTTGMLLIDRLEYRGREGRDGFKLEGEGWYGGDYHKLWVKGEAEGAFGEVPEQAEVQLLYSRSLNPWFNLQAGVRHDFQPDPERTHLVLGIQGLAPYWFEVDGQLFLSHKGDVTARLEAEYDQRITQKLILQPALEFDLAAQDVPELGIGAGLSSIESGLRLRYEFAPEFAPYLGVEYERKLGETADFARAAGDDVGGWSFLAGVRVWF